MINCYCVNIYYNKCDVIFQLQIISKNISPNLS
ncbi:hypothetical protein EAH69_13570 [Faecalibacter macacae]|uniref:Uncharacterized protein n=1 Tax=Faecalibacter macacae TaxID=1859289 RepID=A0A3L9M108_9FLAO|nr:hypothetical protein EAH69_13570 [Faecalibacter macacae]